MPPRRDRRRGQRVSDTPHQRPSTPSPSFQLGGGRGALVDPGHCQPLAPPSPSPSFPPRPTWAALLNAQPSATSSVVQARPHAPSNLRPAQPPAPSSVDPAKTTSPASSSSGPVEQLKYAQPSATSSVVQARPHAPSSWRPAQPPVLSSVDPAKTTSPASSSSGPVEQLKFTSPTRPPERPGFGSQGRKIKVRANHFPVQLAVPLEQAEKNLYHYNVLIRPKGTSKKRTPAKVNRDIISKIVRSDFGGKTPAYDGWNSLFTVGQLQFVPKKYVVKSAEDCEFEVEITPVATNCQSGQKTVQILNTVAPSESNVVFGSSFFPTPLVPTEKLGGGVESWTGFRQTLRPTQMGLSLNINVSVAPVFEVINVNEFVAKYLNVRGSLRVLPDQDRVKVERVLNGVKVRCTTSTHCITYKITGVSPKPVNMTMFIFDGKTVSVADYFSKRYDVTLNYPLLPALQAGNNERPIFLPMELCRIVEGQRYSWKLNENQVAEILKVSREKPSEREASIKQIVDSNHYNTITVVQEFGISVKDQPALINARVLPPPRLKCRNNQGKDSVVYPKLGAWKMSDKKFHDCGQVYRWTLVNFSEVKDQEFAIDFSQKIIEMCTSKGMVFNPKPIVPIRSVDPNQIETALVDVHEEAVAKLANQNGMYLQLLIIILPDDVSGSYGKIKRICETELGIVTQCCRPSKASKLNKQYLESLSLKINVKVGGRNVVLNDAIHLVSDLPTIIFGADVTHPSPGDDFTPSIAAVVASMDWPQATRYRGTVSSQSPREEIIQDLHKEGLGGMISELLIAFSKAAGDLPRRIIFYRDGVGERQFSQVLLHEMNAILKACEWVRKNYLPQVTFIVVQKRHHTRLFPDQSDSSLSNRSGNIPPGTVVDNEICHPTEHDFYLNSHAGTSEGTSRPAHYHVLFDGNKFSADELQILTNKLCYKFARSTRAVSIVPPVYYAHLAAFRARYYLEDCQSEGEGVRDGNGKLKSLPTIKGNVKDVMFFC